MAQNVPVSSLPRVSPEGDPQIVVTGTFTSKEKGDLIVFSIPFGFWKILCIVNIPEEGRTTAPVYVKFIGGDLDIVSELQRLVEKTRSFAKTLLEKFIHSRELFVEI